jgi:hypothetical protein
MRFMKGLTTALLIIGTLFVLPVILIVQLPYLSLMALWLALVVLLCAVLWVAGDAVSDHCRRYRDHHRPPPSVAK